VTSFLAVLTSMTLSDLELPKIGCFKGFVRFSMHTSRVSFDEMAGDRPRQCANKLLRLSRVS